jgi:polysaccharide deacetylase 2 family uncharacterized protein YibQ
MVIGTADLVFWRIWPMGDNNILPKGGFFRGVLAGLTLISLIFIGLANGFPLMVTTSSAPTMITELDTAPAQPAPESEDSSDDIIVTTEAPTPVQPESNLAPLEESSPIVAAEPNITAPVSAISQLEAVPTNDIQIGSSVSAPPVISLPSVPAIEVPVISVSPTVEETTIAPDVSSEIVQATAENDITTEPQITEPDPEPTIIAETPAVTEAAEEQTGELELTGQTLIASSEPAQADTAEVSETLSGTAFGAFSAEFIDDGALPLMSFILLATSVADAEAISGFSTPVTLAVASENPATKDIISSYRASGGEVVLLLPSEGGNALLKGGNPSDVPSLLGAALENAEGVIGVMDGPDGKVNQDTRMMSAMLAQLSETGHAIMTVNGLGLNRTNILALEAGVPATDISRFIDTADGTIAVIRVLDKLVLQIGEQRSVTIFAEATPDMLFALKFWLDSKKAKAVTIAPVSASISRN